MPNQSLPRADFHRLFSRPVASLLLAALIATVLCAALFVFLSAPVPTASAAPGDHISPALLLKPDGTLDLSTGFQGALDLHGWQVTLDGERGPVFAPASPPDGIQVSGWQALADLGLNFEVGAMAVLGSDLYVGGYFDHTGDGTLKNLGYVACYDTTSNSWHALPNQGLDGEVYAMAVLGSDLYFGGDFTATSDGNLNNLGNIVRYDTTNDIWHALSNQGLDNDVYSLAVLGSDLYVGGQFALSGDFTVSDLNGIARYDLTAETWHALSNRGLIGNVYSLAGRDSDLYVGGNFGGIADLSLIGLGGIARYDTTGGSWHALPNKGLNGTVFALAAMGNDLFVGGAFNMTTDGTLTGLNKIARYDMAAGSWNPLPNQGLKAMYGGEVSALVVVGSDLYAGGNFTQTGDMTLTDLNYIARYDTADASWHALPNQGFNDSIYALEASGSELFACGSIQETSDGALTNLGYIARGPLMLPDIQVLDGASDIPDGTGSVDFGATLLNIPMEKTFTVSNTGTDELTLTEPITVPGGFSVVDSFGSTSVGAGSATTFTIRLDAAATGSYSGTLLFANNVVGSSPFNFTVSGSIQKPLVSVYLPVAMKNLK